MNATDNDLLAAGRELEPDQFPCIRNLSAGFIYSTLPTQRELTSPEYVYVPLPGRQEGLSTRERLELELAISQWNMCWEVGSLRPLMFEGRLPAALKHLTARDVNISLLPDDGVTRYHAHEPLYHLLPRRVLDRFGLPLLTRGHWPHIATIGGLEELLPTDFDERLSRAFATHMWRLLDPRTPAIAFSPDDPVKLLAHDLDFWRPYLDMLIQEQLREFSRVDVVDAEEQQRLDEMMRDHHPDIIPAKPLKGGDIWVGEEEAWYVAQELVEVADEKGRLRAILDAVRSDRIEDDFSARWSWAKEDLERRLYHKRNKVKVSFVEVDETIPVHGPEAQVEAGVVLGKLFALCDARERHVLVCMRNGTTRVGDIARELGYANHSPVSKTLKRIQEKAARLLDLG